MRHFCAIADLAPEAEGKPIARTGERVQLTGKSTRPGDHVTLSDGEDKLRRLVQSLEKSIEQAIASSPQVEECLTRIRDEGYELSLVLQATLAFAPRGELVQEQVEEVAGVGSSSEAFRMSSLDKKFLRSLKIAVDEEPA